MKNSTEPSDILLFSVPEAEAIAWFALGIVKTHGMVAASDVYEAGESIFNSEITAGHIAEVVGELAIGGELQLLTGTMASDEIQLMRASEDFKPKTLDELILHELSIAGLSFVELAQKLKIKNQTTRCCAADSICRLVVSRKIRPE